MAKLYYQGHGSYRITATDGRVIYVDPYVCDGYDLPADIVLVTHQHSDHNKLSLIMQKPGCRIITNAEALDGERHNCFEFNGIEIQAVMAKIIFNFFTASSAVSCSPTAKTSQEPIIKVR